MKVLPQRHGTTEGKGSVNVVDRRARVSACERCGIGPLAIIHSPCLPPVNVPDAPIIVLKPEKIVAWVWTTP